MFHHQALPAVELLTEFGNMLMVVVMAMIIVVLAMTVDLISGLIKAKQRGEVRSSYGLKRTLNKFILYEGGMLIAAGIDLMIHLSHLLQLFPLKAIEGVPVITLIVGIYLLVVEALSVREKADQKVRDDMRKAKELLEKVITKDDIADILSEVIERRSKDGNNQ